MHGLVLHGHGLIPDVTMDAPRCYQNCFQRLSDLLPEVIRIGGMYICVASLMLQNSG